MIKVNRPRNAAVKLGGAASVEAEKSSGASETQEAPETSSPLQNDTFSREELPKGPMVEKPKNFINCFQNDNGLCTQLHNSLPIVFEKYFRGDIDGNAVNQAVDQAVSALVECYSNLGFDPEEITPEIIEDVYDNCRMDIIKAAGVASNREGAAVRKELSCQSSCCFYYNSDYYYQSEAAIDSLYNHMIDLADRYGCDSFELARDYPKGDIRNQFYGSYNSFITAEARQASGSLLDEKLAPPPGIKLFFDPNGKGVNRYPASMGIGDSGESAFDGAVYIRYKDWSFAHRVPIRMDPTRFPVSVNLMSVIKSSRADYPKEIEAFLKNFDFFATNVGKLYTDAHPRTY